MPRKSKALLICSAATAAILLLLISVHSAMSQQTSLPIYDVQNYTSLPAATGTDDIPINTVINQSNWQKYQRFMTPGQRQLFKGVYNWKLGTTPATSIIIGPKHPYTFWPYYNKLTEQNATQIKYVRLPHGGASMTNWLSGTPFINIDPKDPDAGGKYWLNGFFGPKAWILQGFNDNYKVDRFNNVSPQLQSNVSFRLQHMVDYPGEINRPGATIYLAIRQMVDTPEQSRYTTNLQMYYDDPARLQEQFNFVPTLRRIVRLSPAARCAPVLGLDQLADDNNGGFGLITSRFRFKYLGRYKTIALRDATMYPGMRTTDAVALGGPMPLWPISPKSGLWEVSTVDIVEADPNELNPGYCYSHKVMMLDTQTDTISWAEFYDDNNVLWKNLEFMIVRRKIHMANHGPEIDLVNSGIGYDTFRDLQGPHASISLSDNQSYDDDVDAVYRNNYLVYAYPSGLARIMR